MNIDLFHVGSTVQSRRVKESVTPRRIFPNSLLFFMFLGVAFCFNVVCPDLLLFFLMKIFCKIKQLSLTAPSVLIALATKYINLKLSSQ